MVRVKVCGITSYEDAAKAVYHGAWAIGFVFAKKSPRYISPSRARKIIEGLPPFVTPVGVFVDQSEKAVKDICRFTRIQTIQFHGDEKTVYCKRFGDFKIIKAFRIGDFFPIDSIKRYKVDAYLFDTFEQGRHGGTGKKFNWDMLRDRSLDRPFILSGGLNSQNVREAIKTTKPFAVDVSSGIEKSPGVKDPRLMRAFFDAIFLEGS
jgi:phosphoribosylanthranilate isomerase